MSNRRRLRCPRGPLWDRWWESLGSELVDQDDDDVARLVQLARPASSAGAERRARGGSDR